MFIWASGPCFSSIAAGRLDSWNGGQGNKVWVGSRWFKYRQVCSSIISSSATTVVPCIVPIASGLAADSTALCRLRMALNMSQRPDWWNNIEEWRDDNGNYARIAALQLTATNPWISELLSARPHTVSSAPCPRFKVCCDLKRITWWWRPTNLTR